MAPRGRQRKVGLKRQDAAIDAMLAFGFSRRLITQTIKELLKVYGGNDEWRFIEMDSYKVLIEAILAKDEGEAASPEVDDEGVENSNRLSEVGSSSVTPAPVDTHPAPLPSLVGDGLDSGSRIEEAPNPPLIIPQPGAGEPDKAPALFNTDEGAEEGTPSSKFQLQPPCSNTPKSPHVTEQPAPRVWRVSPSSTFFTFPAEQRKGAGEADKAPALDNTNGDADKETPISKLTDQPAPYVPRMNRRPFHGLVRDYNFDGDDEKDLVELERAPLPEALLKILGRAVPRPRKRSMWDVEPKGKQQCQ